MAWPPTGTVTLEADPHAPGEDVMVYASYECVYVKGVTGDIFFTKVAVYDENDSMVGESPQNQTTVPPGIQTATARETRRPIQTSAKQQDPPIRLTGVLLART